MAGGGGFGLTGPVPRDVVVLLAVVLATFSLRFFEATHAFVTRDAVGFKFCGHITGCNAKHKAALGDVVEYGDVLEVVISWTE